MRKLFQKWIFYISFTLFLAMRYVLSAQEVISFNFFKVWTLTENVKVGEHYVKQSLIDDTVVGTVVANISFGESTYSSDQYIQNALHLFDVSSSLVAVNVLELVTTADNPKEALAGHIDHIEQTLAEISATRDALEQLAQQHLDESESCLGEKRAGDELFFNGVAAGDQGQTAEGLQQALDYGPCYIKHRIRANAYGFLAERVATNHQVLSRRYDILVDQGDLLIEHTDYFEGDILDRLVQVRNDLQQVNQVEYGQFQQTYDFTLGYDLTELPSYDRVFFGEDNIPRY